MVKRQTVWLSTMMVLSLMLIGYYTMNNGNSGTSNNGGPLVASTNTPPVQGSTGVTPTLAGQTSASDAVLNAQTQVKDELAKRSEMALKIIDNGNSTSDQIQNATQDLTQVNALTAGIDNAETAVESQGYAQCAVVPTANDNGATVYVVGKTLTALKAAEILDVVSQNTGIPPENIHVQTQS